MLLPEAAKAFRELKVIRDRAIHFDPKVDASNRPMALEAIAALDRVIASQFAGFFSTHWFMEGIDGVAYIRKSLEAEPFVREIYLPNAILLGANAIVSIHKSVVVVSDPDSESTNEVTDEEFRDLVLARRRALEVHHDV